MSFINEEKLAIRHPLKSAYFAFPRAEQLAQEFEFCVSWYVSKTTIPSDFQAHGILVTGRSRVGKSREINRLIHEFNNSNTLMPDGRAGKIVQCRLWGKVTSKDLASITLRALGYPPGRGNENTLWEKVHRLAKLAGVIGIHYDEMQHAFTDTGKALNKAILATLKQIQKNEQWPMMLILSGVPELAHHLEKAPSKSQDIKGEDPLQLRFLLRAIHFNCIDVYRDLRLLADLCYSYAEKAGVELEGIASKTFFETLARGGSYRWGLVIELFIEALVVCVYSGDTKLSLEHCDEAFCATYQIPRHNRPFSDPAFMKAFQPDDLASLIDRTR